MAKLRWPRDGRGGTWQVSRDEVCGYVRYEKRYKTKDVKVVVKILLKNYTLLGTRDSKKNGGEGGI